jgi:homoserine dehydrogenase
MDQDNLPYEKAIARAQQLGFAEADPIHDVDGSDSTQKLAILAHLGFGARIRWNDIPCRGIDTLDKADMNYARQLGYRIKLIAFALYSENGLQLIVTPMLVEIGKPLAEVRENFNAISVVGDAVGPVFFHGQGAGRMPTASAVVADMIDTAVGRTALTFETLELWSDGVPRVEMADPGDLSGQFYLRFNVRDEPGVLGQLAGILGENGISIASVFQHTSDMENGDIVPVVIMTRATLEKNASNAVMEIEKLSCVVAGTERLRILV